VRKFERWEGHVKACFLNKEPRRGGHRPRVRASARVLVFTVTVLALLALPATSGATASRSAAAKNAPPVIAHHLQAGSTLQDGSALVSPNGLYRLCMQRDGNLVLYFEGRALWYTSTAREAPDYVAMQTDGNLVIYKDSHPIWDSGSGGNRRSKRYGLFVQNDGNLVIYNPGHKAIWETWTYLTTGLEYGDSGPAVVNLQQRLTALGYWLGAPGGYFGDATEQAVWALQKAAGLVRTGTIDLPTAIALARGAVPVPRPAGGNLIEVNLNDDLLMVIQGGKLAYTLNTSTGGGYTYTDKGVTSVAITPTGVFHTYGTINGLDVDSLGALWRPRFFAPGGIAIHGDSFVPPYPVSHGCVRVSDEAINWIWANNIDPIGEEVWVFGS
jgi:peptidoglycan hydrolase-like protein with peptidoglycan-binding domain